MSNMKRITVQVNNVTAMYELKTDCISHSECTLSSIKDLISALHAIEYLIARDKPLTF